MTVKPFFHLAFISVAYVIVGIALKNSNSAKDYFVVNALMNVSEEIEELRFSAPGNNHWEGVGNKNDKGDTLRRKAWHKIKVQKSKFRKFRRAHYGLQMTCKFRIQIHCLQVFPYYALVCPSVLTFLVRREDVNKRTRVQELITMASQSTTVREV